MPNLIGMGQIGIANVLPESQITRMVHQLAEIGFRQRTGQCLMQTLEPVIACLQTASAPLGWELAHGTREALPDRVHAQCPHGVSMAHMSGMIDVQPVPYRC